MITRLIAFILVISILSPAAQAQTQHFGFDVSQSNPLVASKTYAQVITKRVQSIILDLEVGTYVHFRTFGATGLDDNLRSVRTRITKKMPAEKVADMAEKLIKALSDGTIKPQSSTNIVAFIEFNEFDCAQNDNIAIITDGIEASAYVPNPQALIEGKVSLPDPEEGFLSGCSLTFIGLGQTDQGLLPPPNVKYLKKAWKDYSEIAGAIFKAIINP